MNEARLRKLADHLESGKLGHAIFRYSEYNDVDAPKCGTAGCAIGECPIAFPEHWSFSPHGYPVLSKVLELGLNPSCLYSGAEFFDLDSGEFFFLFDPTAPISRGGSPLPPEATAQQVAEHIRKFVSHKGVYAPA